MSSVVGVDFDNTIACCDGLFHRVARERGLVPEWIPSNKKAVRDYIQTHCSNEDWTLLQAEVYGTRFAATRPFPGVRDFFAACRREGLAVRVISHKTRYPAMGERTDLHESALSWLDQNRFFGDESGLAPESVVFAPTRRAKVAEIARSRCTHFIDDLPEVFAEPEFPSGVSRILFDPGNLHGFWADGKRVESWLELKSLFFEE